MGEPGLDDRSPGSSAGVIFLSVPEPDVSSLALADEYLAFRLATEHDWALWNGDLTYLEEWPELTEVGITARLAALEDFGRRAEALSDGDRALAETIAFTSRAKALELRWQAELEWVNHATGIVPVILTFLPRYPLVSTEDGDRYLEKIRRLPGFLSDWSGRLETAAGTGPVPIVHLVSSLIGLLDRHRRGPLSQGPLGAQQPPSSLPEPSARVWSRELAGLLDGDVTGAWADLRETLATRTLPAARPDTLPGLAHLDGGSDHYQRLVWAHTTLPLTGEAVHQIGLEQVDRLEAEYREVAGDLLGTTDNAEIYRRLREDPSLHYQQVETLVADATAALAKAKAAAGDWFGTLPLAPCEAHAIDQGALAFYSRPARDGSKPGRFFFNTADPTMWGTFQLQAVTYHEGIPGHHLQLAIAQENPRLHRLLADFYIAAYNEGWGLYTERLSDEMGLYSSELDRIGMLSADSMRACRLVVDSGLHALGWSRDEAIRYMIDHSPMTRTQVEGEIDRYIGDPGQALGYMIGRLEIDRMRTEAEHRLGEGFDLRAFHDTILGTGTVPLPTLDRVIAAWVGAQTSREEASPRSGSQR
jgi:uncharacterized protein (DUF885 family)